MGAGIVAGATLLAITGGLAAPALAAGFAAIGVGKAARYADSSCRRSHIAAVSKAIATNSRESFVGGLATIATTTTVMGIFGAAGAGLVGYKVAR